MCMALSLAFYRNPRRFTGRICPCCGRPHNVNEKRTLKVFVVDGLSNPERYVEPLRLGSWYHVTRMDLTEWRTDLGAYHNFRGLLASIPNPGLDMDTICENFSIHRDKPFAWIVHFTDNEGIIAGNAFKKLVADFTAHPDLMKDQHPTLRGMYNSLRDNFMSGAELVQFE